mmetsp:Transcript_10011/g.20371  ORF Transcript_10011/g.20371 Transcript_10011/m.20371 type:complete len:80 (-) Transcript_10011:993-1232(-)
MAEALSHGSLELFSNVNACPSGYCLSITAAPHGLCSLPRYSCITEAWFTGLCFRCRTARFSLLDLFLSGVRFAADISSL